MLVFFILGHLAESCGILTLFLFVFLPNQLEMAGILARPATTEFNTRDDWKTEVFALLGYGHIDTRRSGCNALIPFEL